MEDDQEVRLPQDMSLYELQDLIEELISQHNRSNDRAERKEIRKKYTELTTHYNDRVGSKIYIEKL